MNASGVFVFDTNVVVDALFFPASFGRRAFDLVSSEGTLACSNATFAELAEVIYRDKFDRYVTDAEREAFLRLYASACDFTEPTKKLRVCRDPSDDKFLELAIAVNADKLITRDRDLLTLDPFEGLHILEPQTLVERQDDA